MLIILTVSILTGFSAFADYEEKAFLEALSILVPEPDGEYVTRAEFTKSVLDMVGISRVDKYKPVFSDVSEDRSDALYIVSAYQAKLIQGEPGGKFRPDDPIITTEALKILMSILGYQTYAEETGGYPIGYLKAAREIDLLKNGDSTEGFLTKEQFYALLAEALEKPMMVSVAFGNADIKMQIREGETLLKTYHNIQVYEGVVTADAYTSLSEAEGVGNGMVKIGGRLFRCGDVNTENYLGIYVKAYYTGQDTDPYLCALRSDPSKTSIDTFMADEIVEYNDGRLNYAFADDGKMRYINIPGDVDVIYNGRCDTFYDKNRLVYADRIRLIDNDRDNSADVMLVDEYEGTYIVDTINENRILDKFGRTYQFQSDGYNFERFYEDGKSASRSAVEKNKVVSVAVSSDGKMITYYVSGKTVYGAIEEVTGDGKYAVGGKEYSCTPGHQSLIEQKGLPRLGKETTCYLDYDGRIAYVDASDGGIRVGYIMDGEEDTKLFGDKYLLKLLDQTGEVKIFEISDKVQISVAGAEAVVFKPDEIKNVLGTGQGIKRQLIRYQLKENGDISLIETAMDDDKSQPEKFRKQSMNQTYHMESMAFDGGVGVAPGTLVFLVPVEGEMDDDEGYSVTNRDFMKSGTVIACDAYDTTPINVANYLVIPYDRSTSSVKEKEGKPYLITKIVQGLTEDGEIKTFVTAYRNHNEVRIPCNQSVLDAAEFAEHAGEAGYKKGLEVGDVAGFQFDHKGEAIAACKYLDISEASQADISGALGPLKNPYSSASGLHALAMRIWGRPGGSESGFIRVEGAETGYTYQANNASVIQYNVERGIVEKKGYSVLEDYKQDSRYAVYVHFRYSRIEDIFLYELP